MGPTATRRGWPKAPPWQNVYPKLAPKYPGAEKYSRLVALAQTSLTLDGHTRKILSDLACYSLLHRN
jgi:hypothetical protein